MLSHLMTVHYCLDFLSCARIENKQCGQRDGRVKEVYPIINCMLWVKGKIEVWPAINTADQLMSSVLILFNMVWELRGKRDLY